MPLILITGLPGTGKSTICDELKSRGYVAFDGDTDRLAHWYDTYGHLVLAHQKKLSAKFLKSHKRDIKRKTLIRLANHAHAERKPVFVCGDPENERDLEDLFEARFALVLNEHSREHRLRTRTNNTWGKRPIERRYDLFFKRTMPKTYKEFQYTILDASLPTTQLVEEILTTISK